MPADDPNRTPQAAASEAAKARAYFPRGLLQPQGSFRFSADALLLAAFLKPAPGASLLDLGTGCGVVALAMLCEHPHVLAIGIDREESLIRAAQENAGRLGFSHSFSAIRAEIGEAGLFQPHAEATTNTGHGFPSGLPLLPGSFDLVLANPPFRVPGSGRLPHNPLRKNALFEEKDSLERFCGAASLALAPEGRFGILYEATRQDRLMLVLKESGLLCARVLPLQTRPGKKPSRILVEAVKAPDLVSAGGPLLEKPLVLHTSHNGKGLSEEALRFCPFLACNSHPRPYEAAPQ